MLYIGNRKKREIIPEYMWLPLMISLVCNMAVYYGSRLITTDMAHYDISSKLDEGIPFVSWSAIIYFGCYIFWVVNYIIGCRRDKEVAYRFMSADLIAKIVCLQFFLFFPTTNIRPEIIGSSVWDEVMRAWYRMDAADNLFPSIHCLTSSFCVIAVRNNDNVPKWYKRASVFIAICIYISTLTTKQHVLADIFGGVLLAEGSWLFVEKSGISKWYQNVLGGGGA